MTEKEKIEWGYPEHFGNKYLYCFIAVRTDGTSKVKPFASFTEAEAADYGNGELSKQYSELLDIVNSDIAKKKDKTLKFVSAQYLSTCISLPDAFKKYELLHANILGSNADYIVFTEDKPTYVRVDEINQSVDDEIGDIVDKIQFKYPGTYFLSRENLEDILNKLTKYTPSQQNQVKNNFIKLRMYQAILAFLVVFHLSPYIHEALSVLFNLFT